MFVLKPTTETPKVSKSSRVFARSNTDFAPEETTNIVSAIVSKDGEAQQPRIISEIQPGRVAGYPQMEMVDDQLFFAWTEGGDGGGVKSKWVSVSAFR